MIPLSLTNKYFINTVSSGSAGAQQALVRGRVLGPIHEMIPAYLCELYPADANALAVRNQIILPLEALTGIYLYDDKEIWLLEWERVVKLVSDGRKAERDERARQRRATKFAEKLRKETGMTGMQVVQVDGDDPQALRSVIDALLQQTTVQLPTTSAAAPAASADPQDRPAADERVQQPETCRQHDHDANDHLDR